MAEKFKVAIIGAGMIANAAHIPAWKHLDEVELVGAADIRPAAAQETARRYEIPHAYSDPQKMLDELEPDIVSVCTPNVYHKEWTLAALKAGAHVLCEKPISTSHADAVEMYETADANDRLLMVSQTVRFGNAFQAAKEIAASGKLGEMYFGEINCIRRRGIPKWGMFHMQEHNAGGPIFDLGVHMIDAVFWIMDNPQVIAASAQTYTKLGNQDEGLVESLAESGAPIGVFTPRPYDYREFDVEDFASCYIRLENGATVMLKTSWAINLPDKFSVAVAGTEGGIQLPPLQLLTNMGRYQVEIAPKVLQGRDVPFEGHWSAVENFVAAIRGEQEMFVKRAEVLNVIRAIEGLYLSAAEGREIRFDD